MKSNARWTALALALLAGGGAAQDAQKNQTEAAKPAAETPAKKLEALTARFNKQQKEVYDAYEKAPEEERGKILAGLPGKDYIPEFKAIAEEAKGTDTAAQAWIWVLRLNQDDNKAALAVIDLLLAEYMQSPALGMLPSELRYASPRFGQGPVVEALRSLASESPHDAVKARALSTLGNVLLESKKESDRAEARDCLEALKTEFGTVDSGRGTYGESAERCLFELDHLQIGMAAPDFEASDENGVAWKLSDYKGKVVVIDFWGNW